MRSDKQQKLSEARKKSLEYIEEGYSRQQDGAGGGGSAEALRMQGQRAGGLER